MQEPQATVADVEGRLSEFRRYLANDIAERMFVTEPYRVREMAAGLPHWPASYTEVFRSPAGGTIVLGAGVYLLFNQADFLLYVGKSVSVGFRLSAYFQYAADRTCQIIDPALDQTYCVRAIPLEPEIGFLAPALEWFLIERLHPPVNKQGRVSSS